MTSNGTQSQQADGSWAPAEPMPWQPGIDWEFYGKRGDKRTAVAYDGPTELGRVTGRGLWFAIRVLLVNVRLRRATR